MELRPFASFVALSSLLSLFGCASAQATRYGADGWRIECADKMSACASRADAACGTRGYTVVGGGTKTEQYGGKTGYQAQARTTELLIRCGETEEPVEELKLPPRADEGAPENATPPLPAAALPAPSAPPATTATAPSAAPGAVATPPAAAPSACLPGSTQKCIGPGACDGGQACLADGSGFGPCDCGTPAGAPKNL